MSIILLIVLAVIYALALEKSGAGSPTLLILVWVMVAVTISVFFTIGWVAGILSIPIPWVTIFLCGSITHSLKNKK